MPASPAINALRKRMVLAIGGATANALHRIGIESVLTPTVETSEGLLRLPQLQHVSGNAIGLVTAPGGRGVIASTLIARGATVCIAYVYARQPARLTNRHLQSLVQAKGQGAVMVTSAEALNNVLQRLSGGDLANQAHARLLDCTAIVASARLESTVRTAGFSRILTALTTRPSDMLAALCAHANAPGFR